MNFRNLFVQNNSPKDFRQEYGDPRASILPDSVRYALKYCDGRVGMNEIESLIRNPHFEKLGKYFLLKIFDGSIHQRKLLDDILNGENIEYIFDEGNENRVNGNIDGCKSIRYSQQSRSFFHDKFEEIAQRCFSNSESLPLLISYAGLIGLSEFAEQCPFNGCFGIILEEQTCIANSPIGYIIRKSDDRLDVQHIDEMALGHYENVTLIDDMQYTGQTERDLRSKWQEFGTVPPISSFESALKIQCEVEI